MLLSSDLGSVYIGRKIQVEGVHKELLTETAWGNFLDLATNHVYNYFLLIICFVFLFNFLQSFFLKQRYFGQMDPSRHRAQKCWQVRQRSFSFQYFALFCDFFMLQCCEESHLPSGTFFFFLALLFPLGGVGYPQPVMGTVGLSQPHRTSGPSRGQTVVVCNSRGILICHLEQT